MLQDMGSERAVLAGIYQYGNEGLVDVADLISADSFTVESNQILYTCLTQALNDHTKLDLTSIMTTAERLGLTDRITKNKKDIAYIRSLLNFPIKLENVRSYGKRLAKLDFTRRAQASHKLAHTKLGQITGSESIEAILSISESAIFDLIQEINQNKDDQPELITDNGEELLQHLIDNPCEMAGLPTPWKIYNSTIGGGLRKGGVNLIGARPKCLYSQHNVYTPSGPVKIKNIKVNDIICHPDGSTVKVIESYQEQLKQTYKVEFKDGNSIICCEDHIWSVCKRYPYNNQQPILKTTKELLNDLKISKNEYKWDVLLPKPTLFNKQPIELNPYILGLLTGLYKRKSKTKFIPKHYIYNSIDVRLGILRGLMDTNGDCTCNKHGKSRCRFSTISLQLANDVKDIVQSLGGLCSIRIQLGTYKDKTHISYRCEIRLPNYNPFKLKRKANQVISKTNRPFKRTIINITKYNILPTKCIKTDNSDGLFLTDNFIPTHNCGKTTVGKEIALHFTLTLGLPVLFLDTEMIKHDQLFRSLASLSKVSITDIETGNFGSNEEEKVKVFKAIKTLKQARFYHTSIAGKPFEEVLSIIRRWIIKEVGYNDTGAIKDCLVIYDYFKLMSPDVLQDMQEHQALGFQVSRLSDFAKEYQFPCLAFVQLNRDGITKETSDIISQSDRLVWLCHSVAIFKPKNADEIQIDGAENGNRKMIVLESRFGGGMQVGEDYINLQFDREISKITELNSKLGLEQPQDLSEGGFNDNAPKTSSETL